ncbi:hypothetical protein B0H14DRAFT_2610620 [Mycena olivaceomarginata]|nr:hypothetical protein B0H14DRAFT_2610620 [Mycena olivaceomarginata]
MSLSLKTHLEKRSIVLEPKQQFECSEMVKLLVSDQSPLFYSETGAQASYNVSKLSHSNQKVRCSQKNCFKQGFVSPGVRSQKLLFILLSSRFKEGNGEMTVNTEKSGLQCFPYENEDRVNIHGWYSIYFLQIQSTQDDYITESLGLGALSDSEGAQKEGSSEKTMKFRALPVMASIA